MKFAKNYSQKNVDSYVGKVDQDLKQHEKCQCSTSCSIFADIHGRSICNNCGRPITLEAKIVTIPYWFYGTN